MLTVDEAKAMVKAVAADPECTRRIKSILSAVPSGWGVSGGIRNFGMAIVNTYSFNRFFDPSDPEIDAIVCTGIAAQTALAIAKAAKTTPALRNVKSTSTVSRVLNGVDHTATLIVMTSKSYVFDWHATLDVNDPLLYPSPADFDKGSNSVTLKAFKGFNLPGR